MDEPQGLLFNKTVEAAPHGERNRRPGRFQQVLNRLSDKGGTENSPQASGLYMSTAASSSRTARPGVAIDNVPQGGAFATGPEKEENTSAGASIQAATGQVNKLRRRWEQMLQDRSQELGREAKEAPSAVDEDRSQGGGGGAQQPNHQNGNVNQAAGGQVQRLRRRWEQMLQDRSQERQREVKEAPVVDAGDGCQGGDAGAPQARSAPGPAPCKANGDAVNLVILVWGSRGDFQPSVALAVRLKEAGYGVLLLCNDDDGRGRPGEHASFARSLGVEVSVYPTGEMHGNNGERLRFIFDRVRDFGADIVLYWFLLAPDAWILEDMLGVATVEYNLGMLTSRGVAVHVFHLVLHAANQKVWKKLGTHVGVEPLSNIKSVEDVEARLWRSGALSLYASSELCHERFQEWPPAKADEGVHLTGYWVFEQEMHRRLEKESDFFGAGQYRELSTFLDAGEPPVYIGWGSTGGHCYDNRILGRVAVRALRVVGRRGIVLGSYSGIDVSSLHGAVDSQELLEFAKDNVFWAKWAPHDWLFPRCRVLVIHGGCNTTAAALRSGRPTVVTPIDHDQFDWADRVVSLGVGLRTGQLSSVTPEELGNKIRFCGFPKYKKPCKALAAKLQAEDGVGKAVELLNAFATRRLLAQTASQQKVP